MADIRGSILAAMGLLALGCGPTVALDDDGDGDGDGDDGPTRGDDDDDDTTDVGDDDDGDDDDDDDDDDAEDGSSDGPAPEMCTDPLEILQSNVEGTVPTGFVRCAEGYTLRMEAVTCEQPEPVGEACTLEGQACATDADCTDGAFGRCVQINDPFGGEEFCGCDYGCATDDDCGEGRLCACGGDGADYPGVSRCISATCDGPDACETEACAVATGDDGCGISYRISCLSNEDACQTDGDCQELQDCWPDTETGVWGCEDFCCCGRPLLVDGSARVAAIVPRSDWCEAHGASPGDLDPDQRRQLARHWGEAAQLEHASVASFARFALELMSLGAPPELLESTQQAMADEIDHARRCFALASSYAGESVGPAPLDVSEVRAATQMDTIARAVIDEACIGETLAAVEAHAALSRATDPAVRETLATIAADELRHAELGWRTLQWAMQGCTATTRARLRAYLTKAVLDRRRELVISDEPGDPRLAEHGKLSPSDRARVLRNALDTVVEPCARALMNQLPRVA